MFGLGWTEANQDRA
uniref:Uncharacterized protein n=1 Tax=Anguilla anguilla TaxID=7936 RepID=A0A0E9TC64_ANGAN